MSLAGAIGGAIVGGLLQQGGSIYSTERNIAHNSTENYLARQWQEKMSNTAYQRTALDLEKAGLNKMLAYGANPANFSASGTTAQTATSRGASFELGSALTESSRLTAKQLELEIAQDRVDFEREKFELNTKLDLQRALEHSRTGFGR